MFAPATHATLASSLCPYCGGSHTSKCPLVKAIEYHPNGTTKRIEFYAPNDYGPVVSHGHIDTEPLFKGPGNDLNRFQTTC